MVEAVNGLYWFKRKWRQGNGDGRSRLLSLKAASKGGSELSKKELLRDFC